MSRPRNAVRCKGQDHTLRSRRLPDVGNLHVFSMYTLTPVCGPSGPVTMRLNDESTLFAGTRTINGFSLRLEMTVTGLTAGGIEIKVFDDDDEENEVLATYRNRTAWLTWRTCEFKLVQFKRGHRLRWKPYVALWPKPPEGCVGFGGPAPGFKSELQTFIPSHAHAWFYDAATLSGGVPDCEELAGMTIRPTTLFHLDDGRVDPPDEIWSQALLQKGGEVGPSGGPAEDFNSLGGFKLLGDKTWLDVRYRAATPYTAWVDNTHLCFYSGFSTWSDPCLRNTASVSGQEYRVTNRLVWILLDVEIITPSIVRYRYTIFPIVVWQTDALPGEFLIESMLPQSFGYSIPGDRSITETLFDYQVTAPSGEDPDDEKWRHRLERMGEAADVNNMPCEPPGPPPETCAGPSLWKAIKVDLGGGLYFFTWSLVSSSCEGNCNSSECNPQPPLPLPVVPVTQAEAEEALIWDLDTETETTPAEGVCACGPAYVAPEPPCAIDPEGPPRYRIATQFNSVTSKYSLAWYQSSGSSGCGGACESNTCVPHPPLSPELPLTEITAAEIEASWTEQLGVEHLGRCVCGSAWEPPVIECPDCASTSGVSIKIHINGTYVDEEITLGKTPGQCRWSGYGMMTGADNEFRLTWASGVWTLIMYDTMNDVLLAQWSGLGRSCDWFNWLTKGSGGSHWPVGVPMTRQI